MESEAASDVPQWHVVGEWFDVCRCDIPCPCEFAQPPTDNWCQGVLAWNIREGHYGDVRLDGLSLIAVGEYEGNIWSGDTKADMGLFIDERADESQREALQVIFGGQAGAVRQISLKLLGRCAASSSSPLSSRSQMALPTGERRSQARC